MTPQPGTPEFKEFLDSFSKAIDVLEQNNQLFDRSIVDSNELKTLISGWLRRLIDVPATL